MREALCPDVGVRARGVSSVSTLRRDLRPDTRGRRSASQFEMTGNVCWLMHVLHLRFPTPVLLPRLARPFPSPATDLCSIASGARCVICAQASRLGATSCRRVLSLDDGTVHAEGERRTGAIDPAAGSGPSSAPPRWQQRLLSDRCWPLRTPHWRTPTPRSAIRTRRARRFLRAALPSSLRLDIAISTASRLVWAWSALS